MRRILVALSCIIFVVGINGAPLELPTSVDEDAIELARLIEKFWSLKPAILEKTEPLIYCQVIDQCCEDEHRSQAIPLMFSSSTDTDDENQFYEVINACTNSTTLNEANQWCSSFREAIISPWLVQVNPDVLQYFRVIAKYRYDFRNLLARIGSSCSNEEKHAFICASNKKLVEACVGKILRGINADDSYETYQEYLVKTKQILINVSQRLTEVFNENTNTN